MSMPKRTCQRGNLKYSVQYAHRLVICIRVQGQLFFLKMKPIYLRAQAPVHIALPMFADIYFSIDTKYNPQLKILR